MPKALLDFLGYKVYFWANEGEPLEPVHVHVSKGKQTASSTKFWITRENIELANNNSNIPQNDLRKIQKYLWANRDTIIARWYQYFSFDF